MSGGGDVAGVCVWEGVWEGERRGDGGKVEEGGEWCGGRGRGGERESGGVRSEEAGVESGEVREVSGVRGKSGEVGVWCESGGGVWRER